jgi:hypothetical protein
MVIDQWSQNIVRLGDQKLFLNELTPLDAVYAVEIILTQQNLTSRSRGTQPATNRFAWFQQITSQSMKDRVLDKTWHQATLNKTDKGI